MSIQNLSFKSRFNATKSNRHAVILAGGDGTRLRTLTRSIAGDERPKQFCNIIDGRSLLDETRKRVVLSIPSENTHFSLTAHHAKYFERPLWNVTENQKVVQPENRGTAPAILYSLMRLSVLAPSATVAFFPSDHYFSDDEAFMQCVESAFSTAEFNPSSIVLLGIEPDKAETSYGWIEPSESLFGGLEKSVSRVSRFWEKPTARVAEHLFDAGCLWNSFVMVGRVDTFLEMFRVHQTGMFQMFAAASKLFGSAEEPAAVRSIYSWLHNVNFSTDVLEKCSSELLVMRVGDVGWSDWGEPERVIGTLRNLGFEPRWMNALAA